MNNKQQKPINIKNTIQFGAACFVIFAGLALMFLGFWTVPIGEIDSSVLTALGECLTFGGSVWGIERTYSYKTDKLERDYHRHMKEHAFEEDID